MPFSLRSLFSCFGREDGSVKLDSDTKPGCAFCNVSRARGFDIVLEDSDSSLVVFRDRNPGAQEHLLVIPVRHIPSVKALRRGDVPLLRDMESVGHRVLDTLNVARDSRRLGFHIPPFNSVSHLHLHVHGLPYKSAFRRAEFPISQGRPGRNKGFSWFVDITQATKILDHGGTIGVLPC